MPNIKIPIKLNRAGNLISTDRLQSTLYSVPEYLKSYGSDIGIGESERWYVGNAHQKNVKDAISFDLISSGDYSQVDVSTFIEGLSWPEREQSYAESIHISDRTIAAFLKVAKNLGDEDKIKIRSAESQQGKSKWTVIDKILVAKIAKRQFKYIEFYGDVQGRVKGFGSEGNKNQLKIRELLFNSIVECEFDNGLYESVIKILQKRNAMVRAYGLCTATRHDARIVRMHIEKIEASPAYFDGDIQRFKGCCPELQVDVSGDNVPEWLRDE
jgi:hypothetical protein